MDDLKKHGIGASLSTLISLFTVLGVLWLFAKPLLMVEISTALADAFDEQIEDQTAPIQSAFKVLLLSDINQLKREITLLEFREEHESETWTGDHAELLNDKLISLEALEEAYDEL